MLPISFLICDLLLVVCPLCSQFYTKLEPQTVEAFDSYVKKAEQKLAERWEGKEPFLALAESAADQKKLLRGDLLIRPTTGQTPLEIPGGLIHDWSGAVFIPKATMEKVLVILQDFEQHAQLYPEVVRSRLIRHHGNDVTGYWRLDRKQQFVPATFDVEQEAHYKQVGPGKWICRAYSASIREVEDAGTPKEKDLAPGEGLGLLWRIDAYWSLEARNDGILAECRTISLSRSIPSGMGWMIRPFIQNVPRESLTSTLKNTRRAAAKEEQASVVRREAAQAVHVEEN
jgi:hypothetical protein